VAEWEPVPELPGWRAAVRVEEDPTLAAELLERLGRSEERVPLSVTDLVAVRSAYWKRVRPVPVPPGREQLFRQGRRAHRHLAPWVADGGAVEVRVRRGGIAGRIDVLSDVPTEIKTGGANVVAGELVRERPEYVEQLAIYCALAGAPRGRLVTCDVEGDEFRDLRALDLQFRNLGEIERAMHARAAALRSALAARSTEGLPRCRWRGRSCEFEQAGVCDCTGREPLPTPEILESVDSTTPRPDLVQRWKERTGRLPIASEGSIVGRYRMLVFPRRAYFEVSGLPPEGAAPEPWDPTPDLYSRLVEAIEGGPVGEVAQVPPRSDEPEEDVVGFRGVPYLVRASRARRPISAPEVLERYPQYAVDLGLRCVATGTREARLVWGFERADTDRDRLRVVAFRFDDPTSLSRMFRGRVAALRAAIALHDPAGLAPCPGWMYESCPYRPDCACAGGSPRSQR
jgi:hypothetical protein